MLSQAKDHSLAIGAVTHWHSISHYLPAVQRKYAK